MRKILAVLLALVAMLCLASCEEEKGVVKSDGNAVQNVGGMDEKTNETNKNVFIPDDSYVLYKETYTKTNVVQLYEYNDRGHLTKITKTKADGEVEVTTLDYTYNDDGSYSVHELGEWSEYIREYDKEGRLVKEIIEPDSKNMMRTETYVYGENGIVNFESRDRDGYVKIMDIQHYNDRGLLDRVEHYLSNGKLYAQTQYLYDEYGHETTHYKLTPEGEKDDNNATYTWTHEYDDYGRILKIEKRDDAIGGLYHQETYEYFDEECIYKVHSITGVYEREYRPLSECIGE